MHASSRIPRGPRRPASARRPLRPLILLVAGAVAALAFLPGARGSEATAPSSGPALSVPFEDDFESGQLNPDVWTRHEAGGGTVTLVQGKGGYGKYVLQAHLPANASRAFALIGTTRLPDSLRAHAFGRAYVFISPNGPTRHTVLTYSGSAAWPAASWLEVGMYQAAFQLSYQQQGSAFPARGETVAFGRPIPIGRWFCLEWEVSDDPDTLTVWADGERMNSEVFSFKTFGNAKLVGGFADFGLGVRVFGPVPAAYDIYYDAVAFDTKRIGPLKSPPAPMPPDAAGGTAPAP